MPETRAWAFPAHLQPTPEALRFDLDDALASMVMLRAQVPDDAFTAGLLGTERHGNGVVIRDDGLVLTIGYLIVEAESVWLTTQDGTVMAAHPLAYDFATGFGLLLPLNRGRWPALERAPAATAGIGDELVVLSHGGREHALKTMLVAKREFAGYWEYVLDEALFTAPPHPHWSGAALLNAAGRLIGTGSLLVQEAVAGDSVQGNMFVPMDPLEPILDDLMRRGSSSRPARPWLGMYIGEDDGRLLVVGLVEGGPAERAGVRLGDIVLELAGARIAGLANLFRSVWKQGPAGSPIPITLVRDASLLRLVIESADRNDYLRKPRLQ